MPTVAPIAVVTAGNIAEQVARCISAQGDASRQIALTLAVVIDAPGPSIGDAATCRWRRVHLAHGGQEHVVHRIV